MKFNTIVINDGHAFLIIFNWRIWKLINSFVNFYIIYLVVDYNGYYIFTTIFNTFFRFFIIEIQD